jgi:uncharacterized repeat protein (TIGR04002 family)
MVNAAMFTAMIFIMTRFIQVPVATGYVHLGDALIYICALIVAPPWAFVAAALGGLLADVTSGWAVYAPATVIIKILIALPFVIVRKRSNKLLSIPTALFTVLAGIVTVGGYFAADMIIDRAYAVTNIPGNIIQAVGSAIVFVILAAAFDAADIKRKLDVKKEK